MDEENLTSALMSATITSTKFLKGLRSIWRPDLVGSAWLWIAEKSFAYLDEYGAAPGRNIQSIWASDSHIDPETQKDLERLLNQISMDHESEEGTNPDYLLKEAAKYFARELILRDVIQLEAAAEAGDLDRAEEIRQGMVPPKLISLTSIDLSENPDIIREAFERQPESLVNLGGALQDLVGTQLTRDSFVAFLGKEKVGKTWFLQAIAFAALKARRKVLFCQCGDLSLYQQIIRISTQLTGRSNRERYCGEQLLPVMDCYHNQDDSCENLDRPCSVGIIEDKDSKPYPTLTEFQHVEHDYIPCQVNCPEYKPSTWFSKIPPCKQLTWKEAHDSLNKFTRSIGSGGLRIEWFPNKTATVQAIDERIQQLHDQIGWKPDIIIADYFDIFAQEPKSSREFRHQEDAKWSAGRRLSQDWNCCVITCTQAVKKSYNRRILRQEDASEDKRKAAHVTAMFGLNRDIHDKRRGWLRVNPLFIREDDFDLDDQVSVLQLIQRGCGNLGSFWYRRSGKD